MHKSRLAGFIIDCRTPDLHGAARFWSQALGMATEILPGQEGDTYVKLKVPEERLHIEVQAVDHDSRVHLDIESDDIEAEAAAPREARREAAEEGAHLDRHGSADGPAILHRAAAEQGFRAGRERLEVDCVNHHGRLA